MIGNFLQLDNVFDNPFEVRKNLLQLPFYTKENFVVSGLNIIEDGQMPGGNWRGFRTQNMFLTMPKKTKILLDNLLVKVFGNYRFDYLFQAYGHITTERMTEIIPEEKRWHKDNDEDQFAGVIYLTETSTPNSGTYFDLNNNILQIENNFNRLAFYRGEINHRPGNFFGTTASDSRLTFTFFLHNLQIY